jgi:hypothetical protein
LLVNLEELSLFKNQITKVEGFPGLPKLRGLSLGHNKISDLAQLHELRRLKALRILTLVGNPIHEKDIYKLTLLAYAPDLHFVDCARVLPSDVFDAKERYADQVAALQQQEMLARQQRETERSLRCESESDHFTCHFSGKTPTLPNCE